MTLGILKFSNDDGFWLPPRDTKTSVYHGVEVVTCSDLSMDDKTMTIFKDEFGRDPGFSGYFRVRPPTPRIAKQAFPDVPPADRGGLIMAMLDPLALQAINPKGCISALMPHFLESSSI